MKKENNSNLRFLSDVSGKAKINIVFLTIVRVLLGLSGVISALFMRDIINSAVEGSRNIFVKSIVFFVLLTCFQVALRAVSRWLEEFTCAALENRFKLRLFSTLLNRDYSAVSAVHSGEWLNRLTSDTAVAADGLTQIIPGTAGMSVKLVGAVVMIIILEPRFCYLVIPGGILTLFSSTVFRKKIRRMHKKIRENDGKLRIFMQDILSSMLVIRSYAIEDDTEKEAANKMAVHKKSRMEKNRFSNFCNTGFALIINGAYVLGAIFCGYGILNGSISYGTFTAVLQLVGQVQNPFANISGFLPKWHAMMASSERLMEAERISVENTGEAMELEEVLKKYAYGFESIGLENAGFTYRPPVREPREKCQENANMPVVLKNISFEIKKGEYIAFIGQSGCGKSTAMKLLLSLYELDNGRKFVKYNGEKQELNIKWQKLFAYVPQENYLMSGTIRDIISLPDKSAGNDDDRIWNAVKISCAEDFVKKLDQGLDTVLGENGQGLSEGQMQRIALARAIFSQRPILLLDESTSALDERTEKRLLSNLKKITDKTVVIVTHRPAVLNICDKIIDFTGGELMERRI